MKNLNSSEIAYFVSFAVFLVVVAHFSLSLILFVAYLLGLFDLTYELVMTFYLATMPLIAMQLILIKISKKYEEISNRVIKDSVKVIFNNKNKTI